MVSNGAGAIVLPSFFEEQFVVKNRMVGSPSKYDLKSYIAMVESAVAHTTIPIIASISGCCTADWQNVASKIESAGANAIEFSIRGLPGSKTQDSRTIEDEIVHGVKKLKSSIGIPLVVKLTRNFTSINDLASRLQPHIDGLVLYGRSPVVDIELDSLKRSFRWDFTEPGSIVRSLESIMNLHRHLPEISVAACGGIGSSIDLIKVLLSGADAAMVTSAVYRDGVNVVNSIIQGLVHFMECHDMKSVAELQLAKLCSAKQDDAPWSADLLSEPSRTTGEASPKPAFVGDRYGHTIPPAEGS